MLRKSLPVTLSLLLSFFLLSGCQLFEQKTPAPPTIPPAVGTLNLYNIDPVTLDPAVSGDATSHDYIVQIFSGLVRLDDSLSPAPDIAEKWDISRDGKTYTFHLRKDVKFHDGRPVKADDFKYSFERAADPATGSNTAATYLGDIVGVKDMLAGKTREIIGIKALDDFTLQVTIDSPKSYFLSKLTYNTAFVVDRHNAETGKDWWRTPNGTGPFKLKQWDERRLLILDRNELYYGSMAKMQSVVYKILAGIPMDLYETGEIDVVGVPLAYLERASDPAGPFAGQLRTAPELSFSYLGFNATQPPFDDVNIRRAFSHAINKDKIALLTFKNTAQRADGILPPGIPGYNKDLTGLKFDIDKARQLIATSRYGSVANLPPITLTTSGFGGGISSELQAIIFQWKQDLGIEVKVRQLEPERFVYKLREEVDQMFAFGWIADYPHPQDFLDILFRSGSENNYGGYHNPEVDALLDKAGREANFNASLALYQQVEQKLVDEAAVIPLFFPQNHTLVKPYIKGYNPNPLGFVMLNNVSVEPH
ncbi:MAG: peptide ABC transporter substrate-binding protein [Chloroflexi bacterium]|nr:peptide ABC transporter substrate-binding protein [Chloroflexota bacterium]